MEKPHISLSEALQGTEAEVAAEVAASDDITVPDGEKTTQHSADEITLAEQRGYLRGRNEAIAEQMQKPGLWEEPQPRHCVSILDNLRPGVWD